MPTRSSGFTLIELLVVVAVIGILSTIGLVQYQGYVAGTKLKSTKNAMQQILLAQTEELSNSGSFLFLLVLVQLANQKLLVLMKLNLFCFQVET